MEISAGRGGFSGKRKKNGEKEDDGEERKGHGNYNGFSFLIQYLLGTTSTVLMCRDPVIVDLRKFLLWKKKIGLGVNKTETD